MMYENGKAVKSASRTVGSSTYNFNANGEAALLPASNKKTGTYTVQKGDSFWLTAKKVGCTMADLEQLNGKSRNDFIMPVRHIAGCHYELDRGIIGYIDFKRYGEDCIRQEHGSFTEYGYIAYHGTTPAVLTMLQQEDAPVMQMGGMS